MGCWMMPVLPLCFFHVVLIYLQWEFITLTKTVVWTLLTLLGRYRKQLWLFYFSVTCLVSSTYPSSTVPCWGDSKVGDAKPPVLGFLHIIWVFLLVSMVWPMGVESKETEFWLYCPLIFSFFLYSPQVRRVKLLSHRVWIISTLLSIRKVYDDSIGKVINSENFFLSS